MKKSVIRKQISSFAAVFFRWFFVVGVGWPWNVTFDRFNTYVKCFSCPAPTRRPKSVHLTWYVILPERVHHRHTMCHHDTIDLMFYGTYSFSREANFQEHDATLCSEITYTHQSAHGAGRMKIILLPLSKAEITTGSCGYMYVYTCSDTQYLVYHMPPGSVSAVLCWTSLKKLECIKVS